MSTDSIEYDEIVVTLTITATSLGSETDAKSVEAMFQVEILHPCRNVPLDPPQWAETFAQFDQRDLMKDLDYMKAAFGEQPECGNGLLGENFLISHSVTEMDDQPFSF